MLKNNYHTHVLYCNHAEGHVIDYVKKAVELNFNEIGMTDHAPILDGFMTKDEYKHNFCHENMTMDIVPIYLNEITEAKEIYKDKIRVLSGFETEYLPKWIDFYKGLRKRVDYLNLGIHFYEYDNKVLSSYDQVDYNSLEGYVKSAIDGMATGLYNTLVHPDLYMYGYKNELGVKEFDSHCALAARRIIEAAIKYNVYLEVNANGIKFKEDDNTWLYPSKDFWLIAKEYKDLKIIIGADAHRIDALCNRNVELACDFCERLKLNVLDKMEVNH